MSCAHGSCDQHVIDIRASYKRTSEFVPDRRQWHWLAGIFADGFHFCCGMPMLSGRRVTRWPCANCDGFVDGGEHVQHCRCCGNEFVVVP